MIEWQDNCFLFKNVMSFKHSRKLPVCASQLSRLYLSFCYNSLVAIHREGKNFSLTYRLT